MEYDLNIREYWRIVRKRKFIIIFTTFLMASFSFGIAYVNKPIPVYEAISTIKVEKRSTSSDLIANYIAWYGTDFLETQISFITDYLIMEKVAKKLGKIDPTINSAEIKLDKKLIKIILKLMKSVSAEREGNSNFIKIIAQSDDPKEAQDIANTVAQVYAVEHSKEVNKRTYDSRLFIENQLQRVGEKLKQAEDQAKLYRKQHKLVSLDSQTNALLGKIATLETQYLEVAEAVDKISLVLDRIIAAKESPITSKDSFFINNSPPIYNDLNAKLVTLLLEKDTLSLTYTEEHPKVTEVRSQIIEILVNMQSLLEEMLSSVEIKANDLKKNIDIYQQEISTLPDKGLALARLERDVQLNTKIYAQLEEKLQEANIMEAAKIEEVTIIRPAFEPDIPVSDPEITLKALLGGIIGIILGFVFAFIYEHLDTSIGAIEEIEEFVNLRALGTIPAIDTKELKNSAKKQFGTDDISEQSLIKYMRMVTHFIPGSIYAECYRGVRTNLQLEFFEKDVKVVGFTSSVANEGKSTSVTNVALAMAQANSKVLLIEADLRKPSISKSFGLSSSPGLTDIILGSLDWKDVVQTITDFMLGELDVDDVLMTPGLDNLHIIPCGSITPSPSELLGSKDLDIFLTKAIKEYDTILIDLPPVLSATDATLVCAKVDGAVIVYQAGKTVRGALRRAKVQVEHAQPNILGIIINGIKPEMSLDFSDIHYQKYKYSSHPIFPPYKFPKNKKRPQSTKNSR